MLALTATRPVSIGPGETSEIYRDTSAAADILDPHGLDVRERGPRRRRLLRRRRFLESGPSRPPARA
jgi:hypothetical protein